MRHTQKHSMNPLMMMGHIVVVLLLVVMVFQLSSLNTKFDGLTGAAPSAAAQPTVAAPSAPSAPTPTAPAVVPADRIATLVENSHIEGNADAPVTIVEFSDFECPFCHRFYGDAYQQIKTNYIDTGKVKLAFKHFPLSFHANAQKAAEAAECAGDQDQFFAMHDMLFEKGVDGGVATFKSYASDLGLNTADFASCLDSGKYATYVSGQAQEAQAVGVRGTPGFLIDGQLVSGAQPFAVFQQAIEAALN